MSFRMRADDALTLNVSRLEHIVVPANQQNLDRQSVEVLRKPGGG
jgi:hypothetical protein